METQFHFTFDNLRSQYQFALDNGYRFLTCLQYCKEKSSLSPEDKIIVNRVDIDFDLKKARRLGEIFNALGIKGTFFVRLHAPEYNPFSFEGYRVIKFLIESGHEIGYHSEIIDQAAIWKEDAAACLKRDLDVMQNMFGINILGVASHGGMTGLNNLDFWKSHKPTDFGLMYEGYDEEETFDLFNNSFYISDSEWYRWKCYKNGVRMENDFRSLLEHVKEGKENLIYLLIHSDTYFDEHFYE